MKTLLYLHGYNSSPNSFKAQQTLEFISRHHQHVQCLVPQLTFSPAQAIDLIRAEIDKALQDHQAEVAIIGSSLGGYYANYLVERYACKAVLVNPAVYPDRLLQDYLGPQINDYTGETYTLTPQHMIELRDLAIAQPAAPQKRFLLLQTDDETLDFAEASDYFYACKSIIEYGGDHSFKNFERWLPAIADFLEL